MCSFVEICPITLDKLVDCVSDAHNIMTNAKPVYTLRLLKLS